MTRSPSRDEALRPNGFSAGDDDPSNREPRVAAENTGLAIMRIVRAYGVETVFGIPGTHNLEFYRHLPELGLRAITTRHEQAAGYAADAWAQRSGLPGVVITTSGPGLLNVLSAAATAYCESRAMLILAPGPARGHEGSVAGRLHETRDQLAAASAVVAHAVRVESAHQAVEEVHAAFDRFCSGRPRPVYIEVPLDLLESRAEIVPAQLSPREVPRSSQLVEAEVRRAAELLSSAQRPAVLAGAGARNGREALRDVVEQLAAPVVTSSNGKGVLPESNPLVIGAELRLAAAVEALNEADVLLVVGSKVALGEFVSGEFAPRGRVIRVDIDPAQRDTNLTADLALIGDSGAVLPKLLDAIAELRGAEPANSRAGAPQPWLDVQRVRDDCRAEAAAADPLSQAIAARIARCLPRGVVLTGDSSQISYSGMVSEFRAENPGDYLHMVTYATLGYGLPAAIGAKLASPEAPVVCVTGDGALMFSVQELQTAFEHGVDVTVICVDNGGYGEIEQNERDRGIEAIGVRLTQPNWPLLAEAFRGRGFSVESADQLEARIRQAVAHPGPALVHVPVALFSS